MNYVIGKNPCPRCRKNGKDKSGDNLMYYGEGKGCFCHACGYTELSDDERERRGIDDYVFEESEVSTRQPITDKELDKIKGYTNTKGQDTRGISDETYKHYAVRFKYDEETGDVSDHYYPYFSNTGKLEGFKVRTLPKTFSVVGKCDNDSMLFGQFRWKNSSGKYVLITAGEIDCMSAFQMLEEYRKSRNSDFEPIPVVSAGVGESGSWKQIQKHYEWFNSFERIVVCYDNDEAGKKAVEKLADVLPKGKMFVMKLTLKDANKYLEEEKQKQFVSLFYAAPAYAPTGVVGSSQLFEAVLKEAETVKLEFPPFLKKLNELMAGGVSLGTLGVISASTGLGKSSIVNEICYHWIFNSPYKIGVVSMEQNAGQYGELMLSRHIQIKLGKKTQEEKRKILASPEVQEKQRELYCNPDGTDRWMVVDSRDSSTEDLKDAIEKLIISCDCKVIVIDTISDMFDGLTVDEQAVLMKWQKSIVNRYGCSIINISHQRKVASGEKDGSQGAMGNESSLHGTSTLVKSCAWVLMLARDKTSEDPIERNITRLMLPKNRGAGETGPAGEIFYDNEHHVLWDLDEWRSKHGCEY